MVFLMLKNIRRSEFATTMSRLALMTLLGLTACSQSSSYKTVSADSADSNSQSQQKLMARSLVSSTLNDVFGPSVALTTSTAIAQVSNDFILGGPCDNYAGDCSPGDVASSSTQAPIFPGIIASREAVMTRTCDLVVSNDTAIRYAAAQARNVTILAQNFSLPTDADAIPPNSQDLATAYDLFYPGKTPDPTVIASLQTLSQNVMTSESLPLESWRFVFLTLCLAPDWQVP